MYTFEKAMKKHRVIFNTTSDISDSSLPTSFKNLKATVHESKEKINVITNGSETNIKYQQYYQQYQLQF